MNANINIETRTILTRLSPLSIGKNNRETERNLLRLFAPWRNEIVQRRSLRGYISTFFNRTISRSEQIGRIDQVIFRVFKYAAVEHPQLFSESGIGIELRIGLTDYLQSKNLKVLPEPQLAISDSDPTLTEAEELSVVHREQKLRELKAKSLIFKDSVINSAPILSSKEYEMLFNSYDYTDLEHDLFKEYLNRYSQYKHPDTSKRISSLAKGEHWRRMFIEDVYFPHGQDGPRPPKEREEKIKEHSKRICEHISTLKPGEQCLLKGVYGKEDPPLETLINLCRKLPESALQEIPDPFGKILRNEIKVGETKLSLEEIEKRVKAKVHETLMAGLAKASEFKGIFDSFNTSFLFKDNSRHLSQVSANLAQHLPTSLKNAIESWMKEGLIGSAMEFAEDDYFREIMLWINESKQYLEDPASQEEALKTLEEKIFTLIHKLIDKTHVMATNWPQEMLNTILKKVPGPLLELSGINKLIGHGQLWFELEKQQDGNYTVLIYASGHALNHHGKNSRNEKKWPLRIQNIKFEKLSPEFFQRLFYFMFDPILNRDHTVEVGDLYEGLFASLEGQQLEDERDWRKINTHKINDMQLAEYLMIDRKIPHENIAFNMLKDHFINYIRQFIHEGKFVIPDEKSAELLESAVNKLEAYARDTDGIDEKLLEGWEATCEEIRYHISQFKLSKPEKSPSKDVSDQIRKILEKSGIKRQHILTFRRPLSWLMGEPMEELIDLITKDYKDKVAVKTSNRPIGTAAQTDVPQTPPRPIGWIRRAFFNIYSDAITAGLKLYLATSLLPHRSTSFLLPNIIAKGTFYLFFPDALYTMLIAIFERLPPNLKARMVFVGNEAYKRVPQPIVNGFNVIAQHYNQFIRGYYKIRNQLLQLAAEQCINFILHCFADRENVQKLKNYIEDWRQISQQTVNTLLGNEAVSFTLPHAAVLPIQPIQTRINKTTLSLGEIEVKRKEEVFVQRNYALASYHYAPEQSKKPLVEQIKEWPSYFQGENAHKRLRNLEITLGNMLLLLSRGASVQDIEKKLQPLREIEEALNKIEVDEAHRQFIRKQVHKIANALCERFNKPIPQNIWTSNIDLEIDYLNGWLGVIQRDLPDNYDEMLLVKMEPLRVPVRGEQDEWDQVPENAIPEVMRNLMTLTLSFKDCGSSSKKKQIMLHNILAIMDKLAKRYRKAGLYDYEVDVTPLIIMIKNSKLQSDTSPLDPEDHERLKGICLYFNIDINHLPNEHALQQRSQRSLFFYKKNFRVQVQEYLGLRLPEHVYLANCLNDPTIVERLTAINIPMDNRNARIHALGYESVVFSRPEDQELLTLPYKLLRLQTIACRHSISLPREKLFFGRISSYIKSPPPIYPTDAYQRNDYDFGMGEAFAILPGSLPFVKSRTPFQESELPISPWQWNVSNPEQHQPLPRGSIPLQNLDEGESIRLSYYSPLTQTELFRDQGEGVYYPGFSMGHIYTGSADGILEALHRLPSERYYQLQQLLSCPFIFERELKSSPFTAYALAEFLHEKLELAKTEEAVETRVNVFTFSELIKIGLLVKKYFKFYSPESLHLLPDFTAAIEQVLAKKPHPDQSPTFLQLHELSLDTEDIENPEVCKNILKKYLKAFFKTDRRLIGVKFWELKPHFFKLLKNHQILNEVLDELACDLGVIPAKGPWGILRQHNGRVVQQGIYKKHGLQFDLNTGQFTHPLEGSIKKLEKLKEELKAINIPNAERLCMVNDEVFQTPNGELTVSFVSETEYTILKATSDKLFDYLPEINKWLEVTDNPIKELQTYNETGFVEVDQVKADRDKENKLTLTYLNRNNASDLLPVNSLHLLGQLSPLFHFCPLDKIQCLSMPETRDLKQITFLPYNLTFTIKDGRAVNEILFSDFAIAPVQKHPALSLFPNGLLLENGQGDNRIVLPANKWASSLTWKGLRRLGPFADLLKPILTALESKIPSSSKKDSFFVYSINPDNTLTNENSDNGPDALAYLLSQYLIQRDLVKARDVCSQLEGLSKIGPFSSDMGIKLLPCILTSVSTNPEVANIRSRLMIMLYENSLIHQDKLKPSVKKTDDKSLIDESSKFILEDLMWIGVIVNDIYSVKKKSDSHQIHPDYREWQIYQAMVFRIKRLLSSSLFPAQKKVINLNLKAVLEFFLPINLRKRYQFLQEHFSQDASILPSLARDIADGLDSDSIVPSSPVNWITDAFSKIARGHVISRSYSDFAPLLNVVLDYLRNQSTFQKVALSLWNNRADLRTTSQEVNLNINSLSDLQRNFLHLYEIGWGRYGATAREQLEKKLTFLKGGWNPESSLLILYLSWVCRYNPGRFSFVFPKPEALRRAIQPRENTNWETLVLKYYVSIPVQEFIDFFEKLHSYSHLLQGIQLATNVMIPSTMNVGPRALVREFLPFALPGFWQWQAIRVGVQICHNRASEHDLSLATHHEFEQNPSTREKLDRIDQMADVVFQELFDIAFEVLDDTRVQNNPDQTSYLLDDEGMTLEESKGIQLVNRSQEEYRARDVAKRPYLRLKSEEALWEVYYKAASQCDACKKALERDRKKIVKLINEKNSPITWEDLEIYYVKGKFSSLEQTVNIPLEALKTLEHSIERNLVAWTRLQQLEKVLKTIRSITAMAQEDPKRESKLEELATTLQTKRSYHFTPSQEHNEKLQIRLSRLCLMIESKRNTLLWPKQLERLTTVLSRGEFAALVELLMGLGKTDFLLSIINAYEADGNTILVNVFTKAMFQTNMPQLSRQGRNVYGQLMNAIHFERKLILSNDKLNALYALFQNVKLGKEALITTKHDVQSLDLIFVDELYKACNSTPSSASLQCIEKVGHLLYLWRTYGICIGDESQELLDPSDELCFPIGDPTIVESKLYFMYESCMKFAMEDSLILNLLRDHDSLKEKLPKNYLKDILAPYIANKMSYFPVLELQSEDQRIQFMNYVTNKIPEPEFVKTSPAADQIWTIKGTLNVLLPLVFTRTINVDYGTFESQNKDSLESEKQDKDSLESEKGRPFDGNMSPESSDIRRPDETIIKTMMIHLKEGLTKEKGEKLIERLQKMADKDSIVRRVPVDQTEPFRFINKFFSHCDIKAIRDRKEEFEAFLRHPEVILRYVRLFIRPHLTYWKLNATSDSQNFDSQFKAKSENIYLTGTPYNSDTYPDMKLLLDPGTVGEAVKIMESKCPRNGIHVINDGSPSEILQNILQQFFAFGTDFTSFTDGGALLKGLSPSQVVKTTIHFVLNNRPDIKAIDFFQKDANGNDVLKSWIIGETTPILHHLCQVPLEHRLAYFDQRHGFAANIPQHYKGKGLELLGSNHYFYRICQEVFRQRGLNIFKYLLRDDSLTLDDLDLSNLDETQTIHFAMTPSTQQLISGSRLPSLRDIIKFGIKNEIKMLLDHNFSAFCRKIKNIPRRAVLDKILTAGSGWKMLPIFKRNMSVLINKLEVNPKMLYGLIEELKDTDEVLTLYKQKCFAPILHSTDFSPEEKLAIQEAMEKLTRPLMASQTTIYTDGNDTYFDQSQLEHSVHQEMNTDHNNTHENEQHQDIEIDRDLLLYNQRRNNRIPMTDFIESQWPETLDANSIDWISYNQDEAIFSPPPTTFTFHHTDPDFYLPTFTTNPIMPLFQFQATLAGAMIPELREIALTVHPAIWFTNNWLPRSISSENCRYALEDVVEPCSKLRRELTQVLVHYVEQEGQMKILKVGCLTLQDGAFWKKYLKNRPQEAIERSQIKVMLYDIHTRIPVSGDATFSLMQIRHAMVPFETQLMFLNGDGHYKMDQLEFLENWFVRHGVNKFKKAFYYIFTQKHTYLNEEKPELDETLISALFSKIERN